MKDLDLEMIVKQAQENMNIREQVQFESLDYMKSSAYFVDCVKYERGNIYENCKRVKIIWFVWSSWRNKKLFCYR